MNDPAKLIPDWDWLLARINNCDARKNKLCCFEIILISPRTAIANEKRGDVCYHKIVVSFVHRLIGDIEYLFVSCQDFFILLKIQSLKSNFWLFEVSRVIFCINKFRKLPQKRISELSCSLVIYVPRRRIYAQLPVATTTTCASPAP